jgi:thiol-disulfide isomerase/thioredoxin
VTIVKTKVLPAIIAVLVLTLSIGFFIGFITYAPIQKARKKQLSEQNQRVEETRLNQYISKPAPAIISETLEGERWVLSDQRGKVVVVFFWSVLCGSCVDDLPAMNDIYAKYGARDDFLLVGVHRYPEKEIITCYCSAKNILWPQLHEMGNATDTGFFDVMGIRKIPTVCLIDREGVVKGIFRGARGVEEAVQRLL